MGEDESERQRLAARVAELEQRLREVEAGPPELPTATDTSKAAPDAWTYLPGPAQYTAAGTMVVVALFSVLVRALYGMGLEQTSLLFIGVPTFLGVLVALLPRNTQTVTGIALKVVTLCLLAASVLLQEGLICILMAAPLFYGVTLVVTLAIDAIRWRTRGRKFAFVPVFVLATALEGVVGAFPREHSVTAERVVPASREAVLAQLAHEPAFARPLPAGLQIGFPAPLGADGDGLAPGDRRAIHFGGGKDHVGYMMFEVAEASPDRVVFELVQDRSPLAHWLGWTRSVVDLTPVAGGTRVTWRIDYERRLDPAWYFEPAERVALWLAADYLIDAAATP